MQTFRFAFQILQTILSENWELQMRIKEHPILEFPWMKEGEKPKVVSFIFEGRTMHGYDGEPISAALHDNDVKVLRYSIRFKRPRGFFCAIGRCSSCLMNVDGIPNIRTCITPLREGMNIQKQVGKGKIIN